MKLTIKYYPKLPKRKWILIREGGAYEQHAHFLCKKDAENVRRLIDGNKYPYNKKYKIAMQRILTEEEFKKLNKKQRYFNVNKGIKYKKKAGRSMPAFFYCPSFNDVKL
ncbi:MAG: hypothetical protein ACLRN4_00245 [Anaerococcus vaginalis]|uniref:Uncharacterized protein n=1 Tax=Anaerococcus vaginalis TaxID=33037 RepID=A0A6N2T2I5_9FIRM